MRAPPSVVLAVLAALVLAPLSASSGPSASAASLTLAAPTSWTAGFLAAPAACATAVLHANFTGGGPAATALAFLHGGTTVANYAAYWEDPGGFWLKAGASSPPAVDLGTSPTVPANHRIRADLSGFLCDGFTFARVALVVPGAKDAHLHLTFASGGALAATKGGADGFGFAGRDFAGAKLDASALGPGASAAWQASRSVTAPDGLLAVFLPERFGATDVRVTGPAPAGTSSTCVGWTCSTAGQPLGGMGMGKAATAPAGTYTLTLRAEAGAEHLRVAWIGAPVDW